MDETKSKFLTSLVEYPEETAQAEYKGAVEFDAKSDFGAKLIKHILGHANAGGGYLIVGFSEDNQLRLTPDPALSESVARSYETTRLCQSVDSFLGGGQRIGLQVHKVEHKGKLYPLISVRGSEDAPLFCCKDFVGKGQKLILKEGAIYIRDGAARTVSAATPGQFRLLLDQAVKRRQAEIVQQVRSLLEGSLTPGGSEADAAREQERRAREWFEAETATAAAEKSKVMPGTAPYILVTHYPVRLGRTWSQRELAEAAQRAECHNTGWPMAWVPTKPELAPKPLKDGIRVVIHSTFLGEMFDYWSMRRDGSYFFLRTLAEECIDTGRSKVFFDTRIWDCAEALIHCVRLYTQLNAPQETEVSISITHAGLSGRLLGASPPRVMHWERKCEEYEITWKKSIPLNTIEPNLELLVGEVTGELFTLFEFWRVDQGVLRDVLGTFLRARV
jgi:hypothetical protein